MLNVSRGTVEYSVISQFLSINYIQYDLCTLNIGFDIKLSQWKVFGGVVNQRLGQ